MAQFKNKSSLVNELRCSITTDIEVAYQALDFIYSRQLEDEKFFEHTRHFNLMGFNKPDADILSKVAKARLNHTELTEDQVAQIKSRMPKYARQIINYRCKVGELRKEHGYYNM